MEPRGFARQGAAAVRRTLRRPYLRVVCFGFRYRCPFCQARLRKFLPYGRNIEVLARLGVAGGGTRPNGRCPAFGAIDRDRLVYLYPKNRTEVLNRPARYRPDGRHGHGFR